MISQHNLEEKEKGEHQWTLFVSNPKNNFVTYKSTQTLKENDKIVVETIIINQFSCHYK